MSAMKIKCDSCGAVREADGLVVDGLDQHWVGGQHVCDRFEAGRFRELTNTELGEVTTTSVSIPALWQRGQR